MINYNSVNLTKYEGYRSILELLHLQVPTDQQVWEVAREHEEMPVIENVLLHSVLSEIESHLRYHFPDLDISTYINCIDTHLHINGDMICNDDDLKQFLSEYVNA